MVNVKDNLIGKTFGRWIVLEQAEDYVSPSGKHYAQWLCECMCNNHTKKVVNHYSLKRGLSKSCGCLQKEIASENNKKYNRYEFYDDYIVGYTSNTNRRFYIDTDDYEKIRYNCWQESVKGYVISKELDDWRKNIYLHRVIMGCKDSNVFVDHINHDTFDNRKSNLRLVTAAQSAYNKSMQPYNTSGDIGVYYNKDRKQWIAQIMHNGKHYCKYCDNREDAVKERKKLENKYFSEYGYTNSMNIGIKLKRD